ncbi:MAG: nucleotide sugar dehydrogenase [Acidimicrobiales bacterium]
MNTQKVAVVGQGYVGLPVAVRAVEVGFDVLGFDTSTEKVDSLNDGVSYIDDITSDDIAEALATGRYSASADPASLAGFDVAVITVPTPLHDGAPDMSYVKSASELVAAHVSPGCLVILESTTYPGTTEEFVAPILEELSGLIAGRDFHLGFSPERIDPGNTTWTFQKTAKIVAGVDPASLDAVKTFYDALVDTTVPVAGTREAEMAKLLENTFRHVNIALVNELASQSRALGIDIWEVIGAAASKPFGFMPFYPGPGVGGHCLPIDPSYLSWKFERQLGQPSRFVKIANDVNDHMPDYVVKRIMLGLNDRGKPAKKSRVLILGVAYKRDSNDARETPASPIIRQLCELGANVRVHDPHIASYDHDHLITRVDLTVEEVKAADAVVLVTDHSNVDYEMVVAHASYVFDTRNKLSGDTVEIL